MSECFVHSCTVDKVQVELSYSIELFCLHQVLWPTVR